MWPIVSPGVLWRLCGLWAASASLWLIREYRDAFSLRVSLCHVVGGCCRLSRRACFGGRAGCGWQARCSAGASIFGWTLASSPPCIWSEGVVADRLVARTSVVLLAGSIVLGGPARDESWRTCSFSLFSLALVLVVGITMYR